MWKAEASSLTPFFFFFPLLIIDETYVNNFFKIFGIVEMMCTDDGSSQRGQIFREDASDFFM